MQDPLSLQLFGQRADARPNIVAMVMKSLSILLKVIRVLIFNQYKEVFNCTLCLIPKKSVSTQKKHVAQRSVDGCSYKWCVCWSYIRFTSPMRTTLLEHISVTQKGCHVAQTCGISIDQTLATACRAVLKSYSWREFRTCTRLYSKHTYTIRRCFNNCWRRWYICTCKYMLILSWNIFQRRY